MHELDLDLMMRSGTNSRWTFEGRMKLGVLELKVLPGFRYSSKEGAALVGREERVEKIGWSL